MAKTRNTRWHIKLPIFLSLALIGGIFIGAILQPEQKKGDITGNYIKYLEILNHIDHDYVDSVNMEELVDVSIDKMLEHLDPHTSYIPKKDIEMATSMLKSGFEGIGIEFNIIKDTLVVVTTISGGPSETAGLQAGDKIIKVDDKNIAGIGISNNDVFTYLRGKKGTKVKLSIKRRTQTKLLEYNITRDKIPTFSVDASYMADSITGYIKISRFAESTYEEFIRALMSLKAEGMKQLILDLKDNGGGYMGPAISMADNFLSAEKLIVYTDGKGTKNDDRHSATSDGLFESGALIVLINENSASASEIVSGALQDNDRALIVGRRSFGKGLVQKPLELSDQSELRLTVSRYYTPSGRCIQKPYEKDKMDDYYSDYMKRLKKGELFNADSIKFDEKLKFKTPSGRIVYGGGGIMPDVFIPRDTSDITPYLVELFNNNLIREFTLNYYTNNKAQLKSQYPTLKMFKSKFKVTDAMLKDLVTLGEKAGVKFVEADFKKSKKFLSTELKAYIGRSAYGNTAFYQIINETDEIYLSALNQFPKAQMLNKIK